jgi:peptide/nickel transport system substrate-binding protein
MKHRKRLAALVVIGLAAGVVSPAATNAATKKTTKKKTTAKTTAKPAAAATTAPAATPAAAPAASGGFGGKIIYGIGAESNGWLPATQNWAPEGTQVRYSVIENLFAYNDKGEVQGYLAESATPNSDFTQWTFKLRPNIKFHNGEAFNGDAVAQNISAVQRSPLTAPALFNLAGCAASGDLSVVCTMKSRWVSFPHYMTGSLGAMVAPAQLKAPAPDNSRKPIGTGPFVFKEWIPNQKFVATKNTSYWRGPVLADEVEFRVILSDDARLAQLTSGQINFAHTSAAVAVNEYLDADKAGKIKTIEAKGPAQTNYDMLNNATAPFDNKDCRLAAAQALDLDTLISIRAKGFTKANGPFSPAMPGALADNGYAATAGFNLDKAKASYEKCKAANGGKDVEFTMATTTSPEAIETRNIKKQMVERAGFKIKTAELPQDLYIPAALLGRFQWLTWRNHGGADIDGERIWWHSETASPLDAQALNFGRFKDGIIDTAFNQIRSSSDPALRKRAAEEINRTFGTEVYNIPNWFSRWILGYNPKCGGEEDFRLPSGDKIWDLPGGATPALAYMGCK